MIKIHFIWLTQDLNPSPFNTIN